MILQMQIQMFSMHFEEWEREYYLFVKIFQPQCSVLLSSNAKEVSTPSGCKWSNSVIISPSLLPVSPEQCAVGASTSAKISARKYLKHVRCSVPHLTNSIPTQHCMGHTVQILIVKQSSRRWLALHKPIEMQWDLLMVELVSPDPHHVKLASPWREDVCSMINGVLVTPSGVRTDLCTHPDSVSVMCRVVWAEDVCSIRMMDGQVRGFLVTCALILTVCLTWCECSWVSPWAEDVCSSRMMDGQVRQIFGDTSGVRTDFCTHPDSVTFMCMCVK